VPTDAIIADDHHRQDPDAGMTVEEQQVRGQRAERADHEDLAVGEVDELHDAVDDGVTHRDQGVQRAQGQPVDELLQELVHVDLPSASVMTRHGGGRITPTPET
jgi:hypothetical protein